MNNRIYRDEPIVRRNDIPYDKVPGPIRSIRSMEKTTSSYRQSQELIFVHQAEILKDFEDDFAYDWGTDEEEFLLYPTYAVMTDKQLRGYFTWRSQVRRGNLKKTTRTFVLLYVFELLNGIGVKEPLDGYQKLRSFIETYVEMDEAIAVSLLGWVRDYVIYHQLPKELLPVDSVEMFDRHLKILLHPQQGREEEVYRAIRFLASESLGVRDVFLEAQEPLIAYTMAGIYRLMQQEYGKHRKSSYFEECFGCCGWHSTKLFQGAVFVDRRKKPEDFEYVISEVRSYMCVNGGWRVYGYEPKLLGSFLLEQLFSSVIAVLAEQMGEKTEFQQMYFTKWIVNLIEKEVRRSRQEYERREAAKVKIDLSKLDGIRKAAAGTRDKLLVPEEMMESEPETSTQKSEKIVQTEEVLKTQSLPQHDMEQSGTQQPEAEQQEQPLLTAEERLLLQCLLNGGDLSALTAQGMLLSVLADSINEKCYDLFADTVLEMDEPPRLIEDYAEDLRAIVAGE